MRRTLQGLVGLGALLLAVSASAAPTVYTGTYRLFTGPGGVVPVPSDAIGPATNGTLPDIASVSGAVAPHTVMLPGGQWNFSSSYVNPTPPTAAGVLQSTQIVSVTNMAGSVMAGGGPGSLTHVAGVGPNGQRFGTQVINKGPNQFGGVMPIVQFFASRLVQSNGFGGTLMGTLGFAHSAGGGFAYQNTSAPFSTSMGAPISYIVTVTVFTWTTGQVIAKDAVGPAVTTVTKTGADLRTPMGQNGTLQLVAPFTFNTFSPFGQNTGSAYEILTLNFVPEPGETAMMAAGLSTLLLFGLWERRRATARRTR